MVPEPLCVRANSKIQQNQLQYHSIELLTGLFIKLVSIRKQMYCYCTGFLKKLFDV